MSNAGDRGLIIAGLVLIVLGVVLRWDLIDWLIDATGFLLILVGVGLEIYGAVRMLSSRECTSHTPALRFRERCTGSTLPLPNLPFPLAEFKLAG